jgi:hypothetical protein
MAIEDAINALPGHWDDVLAQLGPEKAAELTALAGMLGGDDHQQAATRIAGLLVAGLPARHPVRRALAGGYLFAPAAIDPAAVAAILSRRVTVSVPGGELPTAAEILRAVTDRLLAAPAYSEQEVRRSGADPEDPVLIWLARPDGGRQWPAFQFAPGQAGALPVVRAINAMLGAAADPVGVADWWLSRNAWLSAQPSLLLGRDADDRLLSAARAVGSVM